MDLNHIAVFVRVAETGSFTAAANALGLPKSSVSRIVTKLEEELGVRLLQRTTRAVRMTDTGRAYYDRARHALSSLDEASTFATDEGAEPRGTVRMTAPLDLGSMELAEILAEFMAAHPAIHIDLSVTGRYVDIVEEGFDLAIRGGTLEDSSLVAKKIGNTDFALFASPRYLEKHGTPTEPSQLAQHACILQRARGGRLTWELSDASGKVHEIDVRGPLEVDELIFVRQAVEAGIGIGLLPVTAVARCGKLGHGASLVHVLRGWARRGNPVYVVTPALELAPRRVLLLREFLVERLRRLLVVP